MKQDPAVAWFPVGICMDRGPVSYMQDPRANTESDQAVVFIRYGIFFLVGAFLWGLDGGVGMVVIYLIARIIFS